MATLDSDVIIYSGLAELEQAETDDERLQIAVNLILAVFDDYFRWFQDVPHQAKRAFECRDWTTSLRLSRDRIEMFGTVVRKLAPLMALYWPHQVNERSFWRTLEARFVDAIAERLEADLAFSFLHSVRRAVYRDEWRPVKYSADAAGSPQAGSGEAVVQTICSSASLTTDIVRNLLQSTPHDVAFRDLDGDSAAVAKRLDERLGRAGQNTGLVTLEVVDGGFYRNRGAYLVGRVADDAGARALPFAIALLNGREGLYVDAVITSADTIHNLFSSTLANFHVTHPDYHGVAAFIASLMPKRPLGLHYSTIGLNHTGKVAVMTEIADQLGTSGEVLDTAVGFRGTVAIGFSAPGSEYVLKIIRDTPTENYKWEEFHGVEAVLRKYRRVHEINRTGSMLDNIVFTNLKLLRDWFAPTLLEEILNAGSRSVSLLGNDVVFHHLIVQLKMVPLPVFLETADTKSAEIVMRNLGQCIKNNAAANIFNRDLDARNYGVSAFLKVYLYDYDAVEQFTDTKIRTNTDRIDGEEDVPDWFFEDGIIFLPEEIIPGLRIDDRHLRRVFKDAHGDLLTVGYWQELQDDLLAGRIPRIATYPDSCRLERTIAEPVS
ncbi:MAG: isocitrate dehydrogenase kinase/phosphatase AceK regulatory subunit [Hyphomicrobiaceae bacterium]